MAYTNLSSLGEQARLAALEWLGKELIYKSDGFGAKVAAGRGLLLWDEAWQLLEPQLRAAQAKQEGLSTAEAQAQLARWEEGLRRFVGELGYGFGVETTNTEGFYAIRLEPLAGSPNPPILLVRGTEPDAKGEGDLLAPDLLADAHPLNIGYNQLYSNSTRTAADLTDPRLRPEIQQLLSWSKSWDQQGTPPILVAHSLGGALVQLLQVELARANTGIEQLVAFNAPGIHQQLLARVPLATLLGLRKLPNTYFVNDGDFVQIAGQTVIPGDVYAVAFRSHGTVDGKREPNPWHPDGILGRHLPTVLDVAGWGGVRAGVDLLPTLELVVSEKSNTAFYGSYLFNYLGEIFKDGDYLLGFQSYILIGELLARTTAAGASQVIPADVVSAVTAWRQQAEQAIKGNEALNNSILFPGYSNRSLAFEVFDAIGALVLGLPNGIGGLLTFRGTTEWARSIAGEKLFALMELIPQDEASRQRFVAELAVLGSEGLKQLVLQTPAVVSYIYDAIAQAITESTTFVASGELQRFAEQSNTAMLEAATGLGSSLQQIYKDLPSQLTALFTQSAEGIRQGLNSLPLVNGKAPDLSGVQKQILAGLEQFHQMFSQIIRAGNQELIEEALFVALASNGVPLADRNRDGQIDRRDVQVGIDDTRTALAAAGPGGEPVWLATGSGRQNRNPPWRSAVQHRHWRQSGISAQSRSTPWSRWQLRHQ
jgi:hypothetical protein